MMLGDEEAAGYRLYVEWSFCYAAVIGDLAAEQFEAQLAA
jgi:hypothetical protein